MSEAGAAKAPEARTGKMGGSFHAPPPPDKMNNENCPHNVLVKRIKAGEEIDYRCMKCGQPFKKPDELPKIQYTQREKK